MKSLRKQIILSLLLILTLACTKEITDDLFDYFEVSATHDENAFLESPQPTAFVISEISNKEETYSLYYTITEGEGYYINNGVNITPNDTITISNTEFSLGFIGKKIGVNNAQVTIRDRNGRTKTIARRYIVTDPGFSFEVIPNSTTPYDKETTPININIKGEENQTYTTQYKFNADNTGAGTITLNNKAVAENTNIPTTQNSFNLDFTATTAGTVVIQFTVTSPSGVAIQKIITFTVQKLDDFIFKATRNNTNEVLVNAQEIINFNIEELKENQTFTMTYSSSNTGVLTYLDKEYAPGASIPISKGSSIGSYKGTVAGIHELSFTVSNTEEDPVELTQNLEISFKDVIGIPPTIALNGDANITLEVNEPYIERNATATDKDGQTLEVTIDSTVDTASIGTYTVTYTAVDAVGNIVSVTRTVNVGDTTNPVLALNGSKNTSVNINGTYTETITATDNDGGDLTDSIEITGGPIDTSILTTYTLNYSVTDESGNTATETRTVTIVDNVAPTVVLNGNSLISINMNTPYTDQGATATDSNGNSLPVTDNSATIVDSTTPGDYTITYTAVNSANVTGTATRTVTVVDNIPPTITIAPGTNTVEIFVGDSYNILSGISATDNTDGNITGNITTSGSVNNSIVGTYTITYNVSDNAGNTATPATRTITVKAIPDNTPPVITLNPGNVAIGTNVILFYKENFVDPGATATDNIDGAVTVIPTNNVNTNIPGTYTVTYTATDSSGNVSTATRTVIIKAFKITGNIIETVPGATATLRVSIFSTNAFVSASARIYHVTNSSPVYSQLSASVNNFGEDVTRTDTFTIPLSGRVRFDAIGQGSSIDITLSGLGDSIKIPY